MTDTYTTAVSEPTRALLDITEAAVAGGDADTPTSLLALAGCVQSLAALDPSFHRAVRTAKASVKCSETIQGEIGKALYAQGSAELLAVTNAAEALVTAHARMLDAVAAAGEFLEGEGLPGMPVF